MEWALIRIGGIICLSTTTLIGAGFDNWLDAVDGSFCTFEGGDDPTQVLCHWSPFDARLLNFDDCIGWNLPGHPPRRIHRCVS